MTELITPTLHALAAAVEHDRALMRWLHRDESQRDERELCRLEALDMVEEREHHHERSSVRGPE